MDVISSLFALLCVSGNSAACSTIFLVGRSLSYIDRMRVILLSIIHQIILLFAESSDNSQSRQEMNVDAYIISRNSLDLVP